MGLSMNLHKLRKESEESAMLSNCLWVKSLSGEMIDSDLMELFHKFDTLGSVTHTLRRCAFVYFKCMEVAKAAKDALQATLHGNQIKIEFAQLIRFVLFFFSISLGFSSFSQFLIIIPVYILKET
ncbi:hypothetical protein J1N35_007764 [Gossypium stocksii]|uniref:RRM domain-containing protein n=1 Tax=Gossypium stocksii TaxID=47602 RepID=A0A9D3W7V2_9ROSI|nr:hypothetical protein J1N35_007764 [Gossypium stocksii]